MALLRLIYHRDPLMQLILTFGLILVIGTLVLLAWGPDNKSVSRPDALAGSVKILGQPFPSYYLLVLGLAPVVAVALWLDLLPHALGHADPRRDRGPGDARRPRRQRGALYTQVFMFGSWLAGFGGALAAPTVAVALGMDGDVLTTAFVVVVIGGPRQLRGHASSAPCWWGSSSRSASSIFPAVSIVLLFAIMAVVLIVRPWGLLGRPED